jgi:hypothetical protein
MNAYDSICYKQIYDLTENEKIQVQSL